MCCLRDWCCVKEAIDWGGFGLRVSFGGREQRVRRAAIAVCRGSQFPSESVEEINPRRISSSQSRRVRLLMFVHNFVLLCLSPSQAKIFSRCSGSATLRVC